MIKIAAIRRFALGLLAVSGAAASAAAASWTDKVDAAIEEAIKQQQIPGAVVVVGRGDQ